MSVVFILVGISICLALFFLGAFIWSVKSGQYEDDYTPSVRILFDDELIKKSDQKEVKIKSSINKN
ncbi:MAG: cbb3-type cytochrome oxidase assembly protein CcoS [Crocinitomicaceae bacterium]|nr:cbb3-type cytochrome oxidase assembly protein CcoS [Crocinitomicaceae bacterium]